MATISLQHGMSEDSATAYGFWGMVLGPAFHRYDEGYRFAQLARDLAEKHGLQYCSCWLRKRLFRWRMQSCIPICNSRFGCCSVFLYPPGRSSRMGHRIS